MVKRAPKKIPKVKKAMPEPDLPERSAMFIAEDGTPLYVDLTDEEIAEIVAEEERRMATPAAKRITRFCDTFRKDWHEEFPALSSLDDLPMLGGVATVILAKARLLPDKLYPPPVYTQLIVAALHLQTCATRLSLVCTMEKDSIINKKQDMVTYCRQAMVMIEQTLAISIDGFEPYYHALDNRKAEASGFALQ